MSLDPRDEIWNESHNLYYDVYYAEVVEQKLEARWSTFDYVSRILVAATASGSTIAGFAFWKDPQLAWLWPLLSGISAVLAILSEKLGVADKLREHSQSGNALCSLRTLIEKFNFKMRIDPGFSIEDFTIEFFEMKERYSSEMNKIKYDIFLTVSLEKKCQIFLDRNLQK